MKKIIFCNSLTALKAVFPRCKSSGKYLLLDWDEHAFDMKKFLEENADCKEVSINDHLSWKEKYLKKFTEMLADVNVANSDKHFWWGLNFTNKNPITTSLCDKIFYTLFIAKVTEESPKDGVLFVIGKDNDIFTQLKVWFSNSDVSIRVIGLLRLRKNSLKDLVRKYTPLAVFYAAARAYFRKCQTRSIRLDVAKEHTVVLSLLNHQSFQRDGSYQDTYFGKFVSYAAKKHPPLINLLFVNSPHYRKMMAKLRAIDPGFILVSLECFLSFWDVIKCLYISLHRYFIGISLRGNYAIDNKNLNLLISAAVRRDVISTYFYDNIRVYYEIRNLAKRVLIKRFYYPFENRSFEKLLLLILRRHCPEAKVIGYQHPSLSLRHTNFLLSKEEIRSTPLPDKIITMGDVTRNFMNRYGNFPTALLANGCALRQKPYCGAPKAKQRLCHILVILATNIEEYIKVILFLNRALNSLDSSSLWLRPHPVFPLSEAIAITGEPQFHFYQANRETLDECFQWADVVLYVHSTVGVESLARGIPLIYLNINNVINPDPLFDFQDFKWQANEPKDLQAIIKEINDLSESEFGQRQAEGIRYAKEYLYPVSDLALEKFLNV